MGASGIMQPGQQLSHDTVQKWIDGATMGAGILGCFSTHCFRRGGAQYWFMFAPVGQRWTLAKVRWWGGWADGEHVCAIKPIIFSFLCTHPSLSRRFQCDTLIRYLLDELHSYETDYSDALAPVSRGADISLAGERELTRPASAEELRTFHSSVVADMNGLRSDVGLVNDSLLALTGVVQAACLQATGRHSAPQLGAASQPNHSPAMMALLERSSQSSLVSAAISPPSPAPAPGASSCIAASSASPRSPGLVPITNTTQLMPSAARRKAKTRNGLTATQQLPNHGLVIPRLPVIRSNGTKAPKAESWKDIIQHWLVGHPERGLHTPLKDWPQSWYQGPNRKLAMMYQNRAVIALEFINQ
jgi:hypothetical protein